MHAGEMFQQVMMLAAEPDGPEISFQERADF